MPPPTPVLRFNKRDDRRRGDTCIQGELKEALRLNGVDFDKDWTAITREEGKRNFYILQFSSKTALLHIFPIFVKCPRSLS